MCTKFFGAAPATVTSVPSAMVRLPSPSITITRLSGTPRRRAEPVQSRKPHGADGEIVQRIWPQRMPVHRRPIDPDDDVVVCDMPLEDFECRLVRDHTGLR